MGHGHRRRSDRGLAVNLGIVARRNPGIVTSKPHPAHREPGVASAFGNLRFLQQWQRSTAGTQEDKFGPDLPVLTCFFISNLQTPAIPVTEQILHSMEKVDGKAFLTLQGIKKVGSER